METIHTPYNSRIIDIYLQLLRQKYQHVDVHELLRYAGMKAYQVADHGHWFSQEQVDKFYERLIQETDNSNIAREAGRFAAFTRTDNLFRPYFLTLLGPTNAYKVFEKASEYLTKSSSYKVKKLDHDKVEMLVSPKPGIAEKPYQCENRIGFLEAVASIFELKNPQIEHTECMFKGGAQCRYIIALDKSRMWKLKRARNVFLLFLGLGSVTALVVEPSIALRFVVPFSVTVSALLALLFSRRETRNLKKSMQEMKSITEELVEQTKINYNNTLLAHEVGQVTNKYNKANDIVREVLNIAQNRLDYDRGMIMLANKENTRLVFHTGFGYKQEYLDLLHATRFHLDNPESKGAFVVSFKEQKPILVNDIDLIEDDLSTRSTEFARKLEVKSFICCPIICDGESLGIIAVDNLISKGPLVQSDMSMLMGIASVIGISLRNAWLMKEKENQFQSMLKTLASSIDARDPLTAGHSEQVTIYATAICEELGLDDSFQELVRISALLHDYGKIGVPDAILKKKAPLTRKEYEIIKTHAEKTKDILDKIGFQGVYSGVPDIAASHHERMDGGGYPLGLKGEEIPFGARIIAVADFFEAVTSMRHYRNPMPPEQAVMLLKAESGQHLDPEVVEAFMQYLVDRKCLSPLPV